MANGGRRRTRRTVDAVAGVRVAPLGVLIGGLLWCASAHAHSTAVGVGDLLAGVLHVATGLEHVLPIIALGLLAGRVRVATLAGWSAVFMASFFVFAVAGAVSGADADIPGSTTGADGARYLSLAISLGTVAIALWLALTRRTSRVAWIAVAIAIGALHGFANGQARADGMSLPAFVIGATLGAQAIAGFSMLLADGALASGHRAVEIGLRAAGSWIVAIAVMSAALALR